MFDYIDFVLLDGDSNLFPWLLKCDKVSVYFWLLKFANLYLYLVETAL